MYERGVLMFLCMVFFFGFTSGATAQQKRLALVIGNAHYTHAPSLSNPTNDARAMAAKLRRLRFKVITVVDGTHRQMVNAVNTFADELNRYQVGLFYFSGHGVQYQGTNYLVPVNANIQRAVDIQFEALNANRVLADMQSAGAKVNIMILDACRNDPFVTEFRSASRGLAVVQAPAGSLVVYSTAPNQVAADGSGKDSPFTSALLQNIETPAVSIQDMLTKVFQQVQQSTNGKQIPWESSSLTEPFYFDRRPVTATENGVPKPGVPTNNQPSTGQRRAAPISNATSSAKAPSSSTAPAQTPKSKNPSSIFSLGMNGLLYGEISLTFEHAIGQHLTYYVNPYYWNSMLDIIDRVQGRTRPSDWSNWTFETDMGTNYFPLGLAPKGLYLGVGAGLGDNHSLYGSEFYGVGYANLGYTFSLAHFSIGPYVGADYQFNVSRTPSASNGFGTYVGVDVGVLY